VRVLANANAEETRAIARDLASFDAAFVFLLGRKLAPTGPTTIALIRDADLKQRFHLGISVAGFALTTLDGSLSAIDLDHRRRPARRCSTSTPICCSRVITTRGFRAGTTRVSRATSARSRIATAPWSSAPITSGSPLLGREAQADAARLDVRWDRDATLRARRSATSTRRPGR
jgi:hypothetical protein